MVAAATSAFGGGNSGGDASLISLGDVGWLALAIVAVAWLPRAPARARPWAGIALAVFALGYVASTETEITCRLSGVEWHMPACASWDATQEQWLRDQERQGREFRPTARLGGPFLPDGEPCRGPDEAHDPYSESPGFPACVLDGLHAAASRFTFDRPRALGGPVPVALLLGLAVGCLRDRAEPEDS